MKRVYILIGIIIVVVIAAILLRGNGTTEDEEKILLVSSDDGLALIKIPESSMPSDATLEDLSMKRNWREGAGYEGYLAYELSPDGFEFDGPVTVLISAELTGNELNVPAIIRKTKNETGVVTEIVSGALIEYDLGTNTMFVNVETPHLSSIELWATGGVFTATTTAHSRAHTVRDSFTYGLELIPTDSTKTFEDEFGYDELSYAEGTFWGAGGKLKTEGARIIFPEEKELDDKGGLRDDESFVISEGFTCNEVGIEKVGTGMDAKSALNVSYVLNHKRVNVEGEVETVVSDDNESTYIYLSVREPHQCQ